MAHPREPHLGLVSARLNWLRAGVLGGNEGIVSTAGIVVGVAAATVEPMQTRDSILGAVDLLLHSGADDGSLRSDVQADDVLSSLIGLMLASGSPEQTGRLLDLLVAIVATSGIN